MWTVHGEPSGYHACSVVGTDDSRHDGGPVVGDWAHDGVSTGLVIFKDSCIDFDRPHWVRIAKVALHYTPRRLPPTHPHVSNYSSEACGEFGLGKLKYSARDGALQENNDPDYSLVAETCLEAA